MWKQIIVAYFKHYLNSWIRARVYWREIHILPHAKSVYSLQLSPPCLPPCPIDEWESDSWILGQFSPDCPALLTSTLCCRHGHWGRHKSVAFLCLRFKHSYKINLKLCCQILAFEYFNFNFLSLKCRHIHQKCCLTPQMKFWSEPIKAFIFITWICGILYTNFLCLLCIFKTFILWVLILNKVAHITFKTCMVSVFLFLFL
jgi:hypothetical protein